MLINAVAAPIDTTAAVLLLNSGMAAKSPLAGGAGDDTLIGGPGQDLLAGGIGNDILHGGADHDTLLGGAGSDVLDGEDGNDHLDGGDDNDHLMDRFGDNTMQGGAGHDYLESGGQGRNVLDGGKGHDKLLSRFGNDTLLGGAGIDVLEMNNAVIMVPFPYPTELSPHLVTLDGGEGNDVLRVTFASAAATSVRATGGAGVDTFELMYYVPTQGSYVITDFAAGAGGDLIDLMTFIPRYGANLNPFDPAAKQMRVLQQGADLVLQYNTAAASAEPSFKDLMTLQGVSAASLTADNFVGLISPDGASGDLLLTGSAGVDTLTGGIFNDTIEGGAGEDTLVGGRGNDMLHGGEGNDVLSGGYGKNLLDGGAGIDTVIYDDRRLMYELSRVDGNLVFINTSIVGSPVHRQDTLVSVERAKFGTEAWAFDVDGTGGQVYRLYQAAFMRAPDKTGLGFWMAMVDRGALSMAEVSSEFVRSPEFVSLYGAMPTNTELVTHFYQNLLNREPDAIGKAFWIRVLDENLASVATVLSQFSESAENQANLVGLIGLGFQYEPYGG